MRTVNQTRRRGVVAAAVVLAVPLSLVMSACGFNAPTDQVYTPGVGVLDRSGTVDVLHALVVSGSPGSGTVVAGLVNNDEQSDDALVGITGVDASISVDIGGVVPVEAGGLTQLAGEGRVQVTGQRIEAGRFVTLTFTFERAQRVTLDVPVVPPRGDFADIPLPSASTAP